MTLPNHDILMRVKLNRIEEIIRAHDNIDGAYREELKLLLSETKYYSEQMYDRYRDTWRQVKRQATLIESLEDELSSKRTASGISLKPLEMSAELLNGLEGDDLELSELDDEFDDDEFDLEEDDEEDLPIVTTKKKK